MKLPENLFFRTIGRREVLIGIVVVAVAVIVIDIFLARDDMAGNTFSELVRIAGKKSIAVPWLLGLVMGHWFHPDDAAEPAIEAPGNLHVLIFATGLVALLGLVVELPLWLPLVAGAVVGAWLWPITTRPELIAELRAAR